MKEAAFLPRSGDYKQLLAYRKAEAVYDMTCRFAQRFLSRGDRTVDQMVQAARSGKQNIAEGVAAGVTSKETLLKLVNVAKASLLELRADYEDFLRVRDLPQWERDSEAFRKAHAYCRRHNDAADFVEACRTASAEQMANLALILLRQADYLLYRLFEAYKAEFQQYGGFKEELYRARTQWRNAHPACPHCPVLPDAEPCRSCRMRPRGGSTGAKGD